MAILNEVVHGHVAVPIYRSGEGQWSSHSFHLCSHSVELGEYSLSFEFLGTPSATQVALVSHILTRANPVKPLMQTTLRSLKQATSKKCLLNLTTRSPDIYCGTANFSISCNPAMSGFSTL